MKMHLKLLILCSILSLNLLAREGGATGVGGGGDAEELRVNTIRVDIINWIKSSTTCKSHLVSFL